MQSPFSNPDAFSAAPRSSDPRFGHQQYSIKRKALQLVGATLYLYGPNEQLVLWGKRQAWKLKSDLTFFTDDTQSQAVIRATPRSILDVSVVYDVFDAASNTKIGAFKRQGLKSSFVQDTWLILNAADQEIGKAQEDSAFMGVLRRYVDYVSLLFPQKYTVTIGPMPVATYARHKNFLTSRMDIDFSPDQNAHFDRRMGLALAMLLEAIETKN